MKKYYFAYGSNMSQARLESRVGKVVKVGVYNIEGYRLVFNAGVETRCFANLMKTGFYKDVVQGVLYEVSDRQLKQLDIFEGAPIFYNRFIEHIGKRNVNVYIAITPWYTQQGNIRPEQEYINYCIQGCIENNMVTTLLQFREI